MFQIEYLNIGTRTKFPSAHQVIVQLELQLLSQSHATEWEKPTCLAAVNGDVHNGSIQIRNIVLYYTIYNQLNFCNNFTVRMQCNSSRIVDSDCLHVK